MFKNNARAVIAQLAGDYLFFKGFSRDFPGPGDVWGTFKIPEFFLKSQSLARENPGNVQNVGSPE